MGRRRTVVSKSRVGPRRAKLPIGLGIETDPDSLKSSGAGIPNARRVVMEGAGHILYLEKPAEFARLAINFLEANQLIEPRQEMRNLGD
jgi:hypothetical protein